MSAAPEAAATRPTRPAAGGRLAREARAALELWLLPCLVALLPYRIGLALARLASRVLPIYRASTEASLLQWQRVTGGDAAGAWRAAYRFQQLVDHADLYWSLLRSRRGMLIRLRAPRLDLPRGRPLVVVSYHFGQGMWLLHWLASLGRPPRFVAIRLAREDADSALGYAYARLRNRQVERVSGAAPIYTGGARAAIDATLRAGGTVYGLIDVPVAAGSRRANAQMLGRSVCLPTGLLEAARSAGAVVLVLSAHVTADGSRAVDTLLLDDPDAATPCALARALEARIAQAPAAWHFWHLWPAFEAAPHADR